MFPNDFSFAISLDECSRNEFTLLGTVYNDQQIGGLLITTTSYFNPKIKEITKPKYLTIENDGVEFDTMSQTNAKTKLIYRQSYELSLG